MMYLRKHIQFLAFLQHHILHLAHPAAQTLHLLPHLLDLISLAVHALDYGLAEVLDEEARFGEQVEPDQVEGLHVCCYLE